MEENNKSYRIRTKVGEDTYVNFKMDQDYDILEILSLKIGQKNTYKLHTSDYGIIAGRVLANGGFGIPNAKISLFIPSNETNEDIISKMLYPYKNFTDKNKDGIIYNLLPDSKVSNCHTVIGTFPSKRFTLDNDTILEVFEKYYKYTTKTNNSGDYMLFGVPTGSYIVHTDIDLSDIGILSQKPRDMIYKGYNINQFENPNKFKSDTNLSNLTQVISQNKTVEIKPFWGEESENIVGITRCDIDVNYKFEPTCVFMGSAVSDSASNGFSKKCIPTKNMGAMDELTTGSGTIEMIRKKPDGGVEEFQVQGTQLINGDGVWCYQIPMNLDYMKTDEYGNMVPTDDPNKGIATRTRVRFRISLQDFDSDNANIVRSKMLVPNNPRDEQDIDYQFGTNTSEDSYRDLFWNGVYSVKSYIPRLQKGSKWRSNKFSGIKRTNYFNSNNPIPYNNIRIKIPFMYTMICSILKVIIWFVSLFNRLIQMPVFARRKRTCMYLSGELCPEFDELPKPWYFAPRCCVESDNQIRTSAGLIPGWVKKEVENTRLEIYNNEIGGSVKDENDTDGEFFSGPGGATDTKSIDFRNKESLKSDTINDFVLSSNISYFIHCVEMNLAEEYRVIQFDFYNDWINGMIYLPRWMRQVRKKKNFLFGLIKIKGKVKACNENSNARINIVQQCSLNYDKSTNKIINPDGCSEKDKFKCHKADGLKSFEILNSRNRGIITSQKTIKGQYVYYFKPCVFLNKEHKKRANLFATDIILLGTLNECDKWGIPSFFKELRSSTYQLPNNNVLVNKEYDTEEYSNDEIGETKGIKINTTGPKPQSGDEGYVTEMSGIDWGISGPYQNTQIEGKIEPLFKPGGHFLGLSCSESETTIVSCVNLSRICEHGVWMSQRQEFEYPNKIIFNSDGTKTITYTTYNTNPTGVIAKDEISDTNYRSVFASLNYNGLQTIIDEKTGYPVYDFKYLYPTLFGGELDGRLNNEYNVEKLKYIIKDANLSEAQDGEIRRTNDTKDKEYIKFRFGIEVDDGYGITRQKKFLINDDKNNSNSMPVYENSFYFYFGLHDGNTALDEFKRQYYAVCENNNDLKSEEENISINFKDIIKYDKGFCTNSGYYSFKIDNVTEDMFPLSYYCINSNGQYVNKGGEIVEENDAKYTKTFNDINNDIIYQKLDIGKYSIVFTTSNAKTDRKNFNIEKLTYLSDAYKVDFKKNIEDINNNYTQVFNMDHIKDGGYIALMGNSIEYNGNVIPAFIKNQNDEWETSKSVDIFAQIRKNNITNYIVFSGGQKEKQPNSYVIKKLIADESGNIIIPAITGNAKYSLYATVNTDENCNITEQKDKWVNAQSVKIWEGEINFPEHLDFSFNDISYKDYLSKIKGWETESDLTENRTVNFRIKQMLMKIDESPLNINVEIKGGYAPYEINYQGQYEEITEEGGVRTISLENITENNKKVAPFSEINIPTRYYDGFKRDDFGFSITDANNIKYPLEPFKFPVLYKPFFANIVILKHMNNDEYYISGQIYNGITANYKYDNFNVLKINGNTLSNSCTVTKDDLYSKDKYKMTEGDLQKLPRTVPLTNDFELSVRETNMGSKINPSLYGLDYDLIKKIELEIGTDINIYADNKKVIDRVVCLTNLTSYDNKVYNIEFSYNNGEIIPNVSSIPSNLLKEVNDLSMYPFENGALNNDKVKKLTNAIIHNQNLGVYNEQKGKFYVVLSHSYDEDEKFNNSNFLSKFNFYSISNIYNFIDMKKWFPMEFNFEFLNKNETGEGYKFYVNISTKHMDMNSKLNGKRVVFKFYENETSVTPIGLIETTFDQYGQSQNNNVSNILYLVTQNKGKVYIDYDIYAYGNGPQPFKYKKQKEYFEWTIAPKKINNITFTTVLDKSETYDNYGIDWTADYPLKSQFVVEYTFIKNGKVINVDDEFFEGDKAGTTLLDGNEWVAGESINSVRLGIDQDDEYYYKVNILK